MKRTPDQNKALGHRLLQAALANWEHERVVFIESGGYDSEEDYVSNAMAHARCIMDYMRSMLDGSDPLA